MKESYSFRIVTVWMRNVFNTTRYFHFVSKIMWKFLWYLFNTHWNLRWIDRNCVINVWQNVYSCRARDESTVQNQDEPAATKNDSCTERRLFLPSEVKIIKVQFFYSRCNENVISRPRTLLAPLPDIVSNNSHTRQNGLTDNEEGATTLDQVWGPERLATWLDITFLWCRL